MSKAPQKVLQIGNINPHVKAAKYAVRGELAVKSEEYRAQLAKGEGKDLPFDTVIAANIGNPQQLDQKPITFFRQVASILENPGLLEHEDVLLKSLGYKSDVLERARKLLKEVKRRQHSPPHHLREARDRYHGPNPTVPALHRDPFRPRRSLRTILSQ